MSTIGKALLWLALTPVAVLVAGIGGCEARKAYYDRQVREMCERDGGTSVVESIVLTQANYDRLLNRFGHLDIPRLGKQPEGAILVHVDRHEYYRDDNPTLMRHELRVLRASDNKVLGTSVSYSRVGGDFIAFHPSSFSCPSVSSNLFAQVVKKAKE